MKDLMKKVLTDSKVRNGAMLSAFLVTTASKTALPWN